MNKEQMIKIAERNLKKAQLARNNNYNRQGITELERENLLNNVEYAQIVYNLICKEYGPKETMCVCDRCLAAIESREGNQTTLKHEVDEMDDIESKCDWCEMSGHSVLYELL